MRYLRRRDVPSFLTDSERLIQERGVPVVPPLAVLGKAAGSTARAAAVAFFLLAAGFPSVSAAGQQFFCTFANSPTTECGFTEESKVPGRATIGPIGRNGPTGVNLHTISGDNMVTGSGNAERDDLAIYQGVTNGSEGQDRWWAHSILFPSDYVDPPESTCTICTPDTWNFGVVFDFHQTGATGPVPFEVDAMPVNAISPDRPTGLNFRGAGGDPSNPVGYGAYIGPVSRNVWYDFVYHVKWSSGPDGFIGAWVRKANEPMYRRVLAHQGPTLLSGQGVFLKLANYHSAFGQASSVVHDRVVMGTTWQDVTIPGISLEGQYEENAASYSSTLTPSSWTTYEAETGTFSGGAMLASNEVNATGTFSFTGTAVAWMGVKCNVCGIATVSIDGGAPTTVDTGGVNASPNLTSETVYYASNLAFGSHTLVITVSGAHSANSTNNYVAVDGFWVQPIASN